MATITQNGKSEITGSPQAIVENSPLNVDVQYMVDQLKKKANYTYTVTVRPRLA